MSTNDLNANTNDLDLEFNDVVKDPGNPEMQAIEATVPEKYKGKSVDDLINMHVNLEKVLSRQGSEVGQLRKIVDSQTQLLNRAIAPNTQTEEKKPKVNAERLLNDPVSAVNDVVESNPAIVGQAREIQQLKIQQAQGEFERNNPSYKDDVNNPDFQKWVLDSKIRSKLLVSLHNYNFEAGGELWELWNEHRGAQTASETARQGRVNAAKTVRPGTGDAIPKPVYSRAKLGELQARALAGDPAAKRRWEDPAFQAEYLAAYAEERIR